MGAGASLANLLRQVDPASRWAIGRFLIKLALIAAFAGIFIKRPAAESVLVLADVNLLASTLFAVLRREPCGGSTLNHWDEAAAFAALCALAHAVKVTIG